MDNSKVGSSLPDALRESIVSYARLRGKDLLARTEPFHAWVEKRRDAGAWPFIRSLDTPPLANATVRDDRGHFLTGANFASQDYLGLSCHPWVRNAVAEALNQLGPHSASSAVFQGGTQSSRELEAALAEFLRMQCIILFPTGWGAGYGTITALVRSDDYVIMDAYAHACLQHGAAAATRRIIRHNHLDDVAVNEHLQKIRAEDAQAGILVVTEGLFSMDSDVPRLQQLQASCSEVGATLLVDVAHDLGAMGPGGTGVIGQQNMLGKLDLVSGAFSKTFASNGGFLATRSPAVADYVRIFGSTSTFSNALSPLQTAAAHAALRVVTSGEGEERRAQLQRNAEAMREAFSKRSIACLGMPSPIVPVLVGAESVTRVASRLLRNRSILANIAEFPGVPIGGARFRMQVMATHSLEQVTQAAEVVSAAVREARHIVGPYKEATPRAAAANPSQSLGAQPNPMERFFAQGEAQHYPAGDVILKEGETAASVFLVRNGKARVEVQYRGSQMLVGELGPGDLFGEMSYLTGLPASATIIADSDMVVNRIDRAMITRAVSSDINFAAEFYRGIATVLATRLRRGNEELAGMLHATSGVG